MNFDPKTNEVATTTVDADSTGTTLNVASTTGVEVGDFVVLTDSDNTIPAGICYSNFFWSIVTLSESVVQF